MIRSTLERFFDLERNQTTLGREVRAGFTTFLTMSYILFVNPDVLAKAIHVPNAFGQLLFVTAIASAVGSIAMGLMARYPFATAPGMGLNAYFAFTVCGAQKIPWTVALGAVFLEGLIFLALSYGGIRQALISAIPRNLKYASASGIGMFLCLIGLRQAGLVVANPATLVSLGALSQPRALIALLTFLVTAVLLVRRVPGAILLGIVFGSGISIATRAPVFIAPDGSFAPFAGLPGGGVFAAPVMPVDLFLALDVRGALSMGALSIVFTFLFVEIFDTAGTLIGLADRGGYLDAYGNLPRANQAFAADAVATTFGALMGTSTTTAYIESAAGIEEGGRTGLTAIVTGLLFALSPFAWPLASAVPGVATASALIVVGAMMTLHLGQMEWGDYAEVIPAFLTIVLMPFTFSIANGISMGIISHVILKIGAGRWREVHPVMGVLCVVLAMRYVWLAE